MPWRFFFRVSVHRVSGIVCLWVVERSEDLIFAKQGNFCVFLLSVRRVGGKNGKLFCNHKNISSAKKKVAKELAIVRLLVWITELSICT